MKKWNEDIIGEYKDIYADFKNLNTPCYVISEELIERNMKVLSKVMEDTGARILLAQKGFSMYSMYPLMSKYLCGTTASSLHEARLGKEEFPGEVHIFSPAYRQDEIDEILNICDHIVFNSFNQWRKYKENVRRAQERRNVHISCGLRINPEFSTGEHEIYAPCAKGSRLGITLSNFNNEELDGIEGLHFHTLCEQNSDDLKSTLEVVIEKFGKFIKNLKWINFGGGHHITRADYNIDTLKECINIMKNE